MLYYIYIIFLFFNTKVLLINEELLVCWCILIVISFLYFISRYSIKKIYFKSIGYFYFNSLYCIISNLFLNNSLSCLLEVEKHSIIIFGKFYSQLYSLVFNGIYFTFVPKLKVEHFAFFCQVNLVSFLKVRELAVLLGKI